MFTTKTISFLVALFVVTTLFSCRSQKQGDSLENSHKKLSYSKILKHPDPEFRYKKAVEYYEKGDFTKSGTLFEDLIPSFKNTSKSEIVNYYYAKSLYGQKDYITAGHFFREFVETFPKSKYVEECAFMGAYCYYLDSPEPALDQTSTYKAISELQNFTSQFPTSKKVAECAQLIDQLLLKLNTKAYNSAKLYYDLGEYRMSYYKSAVVALKNTLVDYPTSPYKEEIMYYVVKANYMIASNSIEDKKLDRYEETITAYKWFVAQYPESKHAKEIKRIYENSQKEIRELSTTKVSK